MTTTIAQFRGDYAFLSNFYRSTVLYGGDLYPSSEAAFQAAKTLDPARRRPFQSMSPGEAKRAGRALPLRPDWEDVKLHVMAEVLTAKFSDPTLRAKLLATGDAKLIEGNTWGDTFWGMCRGEGTNWLGVLLMDLRRQLRDRSEGDL